MANALNLSTKEEIESASRNEVVDQFSSLSLNFDIDGFLPASNVLTMDTIEKIKNISFTELEMKQYIAASTITHLHDSWNFLGQSIQAILNGQTAIARHLGYYAELRASMSLLATEGIGIFNNKHYYIDKRDLKPKKISMSFGTHEMIWLTLEHWSKQDNARKLLEEIITPGNIPLREWVNGYRNNTWDVISFEIFKKWGVDLQYLAHDRDTRNRVSYRPTQIHANQTVDATKNYKFIVELWQLLEPSTNGNYSNIDNIFLKQSIDLLNEHSEQKCENKRDVKLYKMLEKVLTDKTKIRDYLKLIKDTDNNSVLSNASKIHTNIDIALQDPDNHLQIIARALFLVRIATGSVKRMMKDANVNLSDMDFWLNDIIQKSGIVSQDSIATLIIEDLWTDINDIAIEDIKNSDEGDDLYDYKNKYSKSSILFSECERAMLWGLST